MKRVIHTLLLLLVWGQLFSQTYTSAFFVYRNDAPVTPFFFENVDSIRQSHIDLDSIERPEFVVTEFWTPDSVHRIPIAVIDSIAFTTPSEIRKPGSVEITDEQLGYLMEVDSLTLKFSPSIPQQLIPKKGEKLTYSHYSDLMRAGFIGKVRDIVSDEKYVSVICDSIGIPDAFDRYWQMGEIITSSPVGRSSTSSSPYGKVEELRIRPYEIGSISLAGGFKMGQDENFNFGYSNDYTISLKFITSGKYMVGYDGNQSKLETIQLTPNIRVIIEETLGVNQNISFDLFNLPILSDLKVEIPFPIPLVSNLVKAVLESEFDISGSLAYSKTETREIDFGFSCTYSDNIHFKNRFHINQPIFYEPKENTTMFTGNITVYNGMFLNLSLGNKYIVNLKGGISAGYETSIDFGVGLKEFIDARENTSTYEHVMDAAINHAFVIKPKVEAKFLGLFSFEREARFPVLDFSIKKSKTLMFPKFTKPIYTVNDDESYIQCDVSEDLAFKVRPGIKVVDEEGNVIWTKYHEEFHKEGTTRMEIPYKHKAFNKKCFVYPIFQYFEKEIMATPELELVIYASPVTGNSNASSYKAKVGAYLSIEEEMSDKIDTSGWKVGFLYSEKADNIKDGERIEAYLQQDYSFESDIENLSPETDYYYCAYLQVGETILYGETYRFTTEEEEVVDLGLSVNWRAWNIGANRKHHKGDLFAWAETKPKLIFDWISYVDNPYSETLEWKGCSINKDISGLSDYDPAKLLESGEWRMPTRKEMMELIEKCSWEWTTVKSINGYRVTGPNGKSIFLPVTGLGDGTEITNGETYGAYWTSTPQSDAEGKATAATLYFYGGMLKSLQWANRYGGRAVRPVKDKL